MERFLDLVAHPYGRHAEPEPPTPVHTPSEEEVLAAELAAWAARRECREVFIPYLDELINDADNATSENIVSHPQAAYHLGRRDALRNLRRLFHSWAGSADE